MDNKAFQGKKKVFSTEEEAIENLTKENRGECFDCEREIKVKGDEIENGVLLSYEDEGKDVFVLRCDDCFSKSPELSDYKSCEVYSRIVGYLRPVNQYNPGKQQEYLERKEYNKALGNV